MFPTSAEDFMENLGLDLVWVCFLVVFVFLWFFFLFSLWWHNRIFVSSQKEEPDQSGIWLPGFLLKQNKTTMRFILCPLEPGERTITFFVKGKWIFKSFFLQVSGLGSKL